MLHIGAQKTGSTWTYNALREHPDICVSQDEPTEFFDVKYHKGEKWYRQRFDHWNDESVIVDESPGYIKHPLAPSRAADMVPDAKIVMCLRNPMKRAYSHWWTSESYWTDGYFGRATHHHATYDVFVTPGLYNHHISRWEEYFPSENIKITFFEDFKADNEVFIQDIYEFLNVDSSFTPSVVGEKIVEGASLIEPSYMKKLRWWLELNVIEPSPDAIVSRLRTIYDQIEEPASELYRYLLRPIARSGYEDGMDPSVREELELIYYDEIKQLEERTDRDLEHWFEFVDPDQADETNSVKPQ